MKSHVVRQGECLSAIAKQYGFASYKTLYNHPDNAELRKQRPNPNVLYPGDVVVIPDKNAKTVDVATGATHRFQVTRSNKMLRVKLETATGEVISNHVYRLSWQGVAAAPVDGQTDAGGVLECDVPEGADGALLHVESEPRPRMLHFSHLNPLRGVPDGGASGVQARLANLGYDPGVIDGEVGRWTRAAARTFARDAGVAAIDPLSPSLLAALEKAHGC